MKRILGRYTLGNKGFIFVALAGVHGNEQAGVRALERVFEQLKERQPQFTGDFIGVAGNLEALEQNIRFVNKDLNRLWYSEQIRYVEQTAREDLTDVEDVQQKELIDLFRGVVRRFPKHPIVLLDLHTTSAEGGAFVISNKVKWSIELAKNLKVPVITGVEETVNGTTMNFFSDLGMTAFGFEAGQHTNPASVNRMEAAIWMTLRKLGCIGVDDIPDYEHHLQILEELSIDKPDVVEFCYRHAVREGDDFKMLPGFKNFQSIKEGEHLANDKYGSIHAKQDGLILMPLYQEQGEDGFFIVD